MRISAKRQVSVPKKIMEALQLKPGDEIDFEVDGDQVRIVPIKTIKVPRDQAWFWTPQWQKKELAADRDLASKRYKEFDRFEDLLKDLHGDD